MSSRHAKTRRHPARSGSRGAGRKSDRTRRCGHCRSERVRGGFGPRALGAWGEPIIKQFVHAAVNEALKLESALARLRTSSRVVLLHYAPIQQTVEGEPVEIYPFVGSSRLEDPNDRFDVSLTFHGHAHRGSLEGATKAGVPVYNVSMPLLSRFFPEHPHFRVFELTTHADGRVTHKAVWPPFTRATGEPVHA